MTNNITTDYVLFDLETTGLSTEKDAIVEIAALKVINKTICGEFSTLVNPGIHIPYFVSSINGITDDMVRESPTIESVLVRFKNFVEDFPLIGHNIIRFDMKFVQRDYMRIFGKSISNGIVDTLLISRQVLPNLNSHSLESLAHYYHISYEGAHRALADCHINKKVYDCLKRDTLSHF